MEALEGKRIVHHHTHRHDDIVTVLRLREEFGFRLVLQHVSEGWLVAEEIAEAALIDQSEILRMVRAAVEQALSWTREVEDVWGLRPLFSERYHGQPASNAVEVFSAGLAIFSMVGHNTRDAILAGVNFGRDCDCISYVAAGLAGALNGIDSLLSIVQMPPGVPVATTSAAARAASDGASGRAARRRRGPGRACSTRSRSTTPRARG